MKQAEIKELVADLFLGFCRRHYPTVNITAAAVKESVRVDESGRITVDKKTGASNLGMSELVVEAALHLLCHILYDLLIKPGVSKARDAWFSKPTTEVVMEASAPYRDEELRAIARKMVEFVHVDQREFLRAALDKLIALTTVSQAKAGTSAADIIAILEAECGSRIKAKNAEAFDPFVVVEPAELLAVGKVLRDHPKLRLDMLNCMAGVDYLELDPKKAPKAGYEPHLEVVYHFSSFALGHRFVVKIVLPRWKDNKPGELPEVPSATSLWPAADWHEREVYDLSGVFFRGHPDLCRILLADDWVGHPLRKDYEFPLEYHGIRGR